VCRAKKCRQAYEALGAATEEIENEQTERVPEKLKNKHFPLNPTSRMEAGRSMRRRR
jgi:replication-associated recombination protein RarA